MSCPSHHDAALQGHPPAHCSGAVATLGSLQREWVLQQMGNKGWLQFSCNWSFQRLRTREILGQMRPQHCSSRPSLSSQAPQCLAEDEVTSLTRFQPHRTLPLGPAGNESCRVPDSQGPPALWERLQGSYLEVGFKVTVRFETKVRISNKFTPLYHESNL